MKKILYIFLLFIHIAVLAQKQPIVSMADFLPNSKPGQFTTIFVNTNFEKSDSIEAILRLPENWRLVLSKESPNEKGYLKYIYTYSSPKFTASGKYFIQLDFFKKGLLVVSKITEAEIESIKNIEFSELSHPQFVKEGDTLHVEYLIQNLGNSLEKFKLNSTRGWLNIADTLHLQPNNQKVIKVSQYIQKTKESYWQTTSSLELEEIGGEKKYIQSVSVPVFSSTQKKVDLYHRLPVEIGLGYFNYSLDGHSQGAMQYFTQGSGYLDVKEKHNIDFVIRGPNQQDFPQIGSYDQYSFEYEYDQNLKIKIGDYINRVSNLIEFSRFGRGLQFEKSFDRLNLKGFYQNARFFEQQKNAWGAALDYKLSENFKVGVNYTNKGLYKNNAFFRTSILGLSSVITNKNGTVETELAVSNKMNKYDFGFYNQFLYQFLKFNFSSQLILTGKDFDGFYTNSRLIVNSLSYSFNSKISVGFNNNFTRINPALDLQLFNTSPLNKTNSLFLSMFPTKKQMIFLNYTKQEREDRQVPSNFHFKEEYANASYSFVTDWATIFLQGRYGNSVNLLFGDNQAAAKSISDLIQPMFRIQKWLWVGGYFEHQHTSKFNQNNDLENLFYFGGNLRANHKNKFFFNIMYRNNYAPDEFFVKRTFLDASIELDLKRHNFRAVAGRTYLPGITALNQNTMFLSLNYSLKLNIPLKKNKSISNVKGRVYGINNSQSLGGIMMQMGHYQSITDQYGNFSFENILPDRYHISFPSDERMIGWTPELRTSLEIEAKADSTHMLQIPLIKTGGVIGKVKLEIDERNQVINAGKPKPQILLKIQNNEESYLTKLNEYQEFSFKEIKPGEWKITVLLTSNSEGYEVLEKEKIINIEPEIISKADFVVKQSERKIYFSSKEFKLSAKQ